MRRGADLVRGDLLLQLGEDTFGFGRNWRGLGDRQMLQCIAVPGAALGQRVMNPDDGQTVFADARKRADTLRWG